MDFGKLLLFIFGMLLTTNAALSIEKRPQSRQPREMTDRKIDDGQQLLPQMSASKMSPNFLLITGLQAIKPFIPPMDIISFGILLSTIALSSTVMLAVNGLGLFALVTVHPILGEFASGLLASFEGNSSGFDMFLGSLTASAGIDVEEGDGGNGLGAITNAILSGLGKTVLQSVTSTLAESFSGGINQLYQG